MIAGRLEPAGDRIAEGERRRVRGIVIVVVHHADVRPPRRMNGASTSAARLFSGVAPQVQERERREFGEGADVGDAVVREVQLAQRAQGGEGRDVPNGVVRQVQLGQRGQRRHHGDVPDRVSVQVQVG